MIGSNDRGRPDEGRLALICTFYPEINKLGARRHFKCIVLYVRLSLAQETFYRPRPSWVWEIIELECMHPYRSLVV